MLPFEDCLRLLASAPVGRIGFNADSEGDGLAGNHTVDGQDVVFRTAHGSKLSAATMRALLGSVAETITNPATAGQAAEGNSPAARPLPEPGVP